MGLIQGIGIVVPKFKTSVAPGDATWTVGGTYSWTVPSGVTSICSVCIGAGGGAGVKAGIYYDRYGGYLQGGGGGLGYANNIAVTPGEVLTIIVGSGATAQYMIVSCVYSGGTYNVWCTSKSHTGNGGGSYLQRSSTNLVYGLGGNGGFNLSTGGGYYPNGNSGGTGGVVGLANYLQYGHTGCAGKYTSAGSTVYISNSSGGALGTDLYGSDIQTTGLYGAGNVMNTARFGPGTGLQSRANASAGGAVRILWGTGRAFPSTNVGTSTS